MPALWIARQSRQMPLPAVVPSYWEDPENAAKATAYYRAAVFECTAKISADPKTLAEHLSDRFILSALRHSKTEGRPTAWEADDAAAS